ncbi:MAG: DNA polymerase Y family protein [Burkholderiales bacterium]|nr:DNA polymerase Y family protein [Burkholderiales bacterium]
MSPAPPPRRAPSGSRARGARSCSIRHGSPPASPISPVRLLDCDPDTLAALTAIGAETIGDLERLPRDGLARRFGHCLLEEIDRAFGRRPDPRTFFASPPRFHARLELAAEVAQAEMLAVAARRLVVQLAGFLAARTGGVQRLALRLFHRDAPVTEIAIGLVAPTRDAEHFARLARERLAMVGLRAPVRAIALTAEDIVPLAGKPGTLFGEAAGDAAGEWAKLVERLRARLGAAAVHGMTAAADHRPEHASRRSEPGCGRPAPARQPSITPASTTTRGTLLGVPGGPRPFWLLPQPRPLAEIDSVPHHGGPLALLAGPERIESGWWDGDEVARDYFIAQTSDRTLVWVYRTRPSGPKRASWYLHGLFA